MVMGKHTGSLARRVLVVCTVVFLTACQGEISADLTTSAPADPDIQQVVTELSGVELRKEDGGTEVLEFEDPEFLDLLEWLDGNPVRLFTDENVPEGQYDGIRLLFAPEDDQNFVVANGREFPLDLTAGNYAPIGFEVKEEDSSRLAITLTLDLRQSLSFSTGQELYTLSPVLRSVVTEDAGAVTGDVIVNCPTGTSLEQGGAVYLFAGSGVTADDRDAQGEEPHATVPTFLTQDGFAYEHLFVAPGDYTLAVTCEGHEEDPAADDALRFIAVHDVRIEKGTTTTRDLTD